MEQREAKFTYYSPVPFYVDAVYAIAWGAHNMIKEKCPDAMVNKSLLAACFRDRSVLLEYMHKVDFQGELGRITFNKDGDINSFYVIKQLQKDGLFLLIVFLVFLFVLTEQF